MRTGQLYNLSYLLVTLSLKNSDASDNFEYYLQLLTFIFPFPSHHFLRTFPIVIPSETVFFQGLDRSGRHQLTSQALLTSWDVTMQSLLHFFALLLHVFVTSTLPLDRFQGAKMALGTAV